VGVSSNCTNTTHTSKAVGQQNLNKPGTECESTPGPFGRKYAKSGDMLPIISAASGRPVRLNGRTAAACEIVNGMGRDGTNRLRRKC